MPDRKKVILGLTVCTDGTPSEDCRKCPYQGDDYCTDTVMMDALALLKEQEPVGVEKGIGYLYCGGCNTALAPLDWPKPWKFCPWCGKRVRWE